MWQPKDGSRRWAALLSLALSSDSGPCSQCVRIVAGSCSKESCGELYAQQCHARDVRRRARVMADGRCKCGCLMAISSVDPLLKINNLAADQFTALFHSYSEYHW